MLLLDNKREIIKDHALTRVSVPQLDEILGWELPVLDKGFVRVVDYMGNDESIVQAARVSYGSGTKEARSNEGLIDYLLRHDHWTPFEMCELKLHVKLPIFVARHWVRHRTASINEYSARYSVLEKEFYIPETSVLALQSAINAQGRGEALEANKAEEAQDAIQDHSMESYSLYEWLLGGDDFEPEDWRTDSPKLARELSRMVLPTNIYTQWYWKSNLRNVLNFVKLRSDPHAQYEIRVYADLIASILMDWVPFAMKSFQNHHINNLNFSERQAKMLAGMLQGVPFHPESIGLKGGELKEFYEKLAILNKHAGL